MELRRAQLIAEELKSLLAPECQRITIAGSIRRRKPAVGDIELLVIPKYVDGVDQLDEEIKKLMAEGLLGYRQNVRGSIAYGQKNKLLVHLPSGIGVDVFSTTEDCWWVSLVVRTGGEVTNKRIAMAAIRKGWHLMAYGRGFSTPRGDVVCRSEEEVFRAVGFPYPAPWERD
jgi:DNA polymerase (family 10)